jgi:AAA15 family ATPase/GTPase
MKLQSFRIKNFRSIRDTDWQNFSQDNIIALIGQNEAGKTTILEALKSYSDETILADYLRSNRSLPEVSRSFYIEPNEIEELFKNHTLPDGLISL